MSGFLLRRLLACLPTLLGITLVAFVILNLLPSDPVLTWSEAGVPMSAESQARLRAALGAGRGPAERYSDWLLSVVRLDLGRSLRDARPVQEVIGEALPWTALLNLCAMAAIYGVGLPLGFLGARRPGSQGDRWSRRILLILFVVPPFAAALLMQRLFAVRLGLLPLQGTGLGEATGAARLGSLAEHLVLPVLCLALAAWAYTTRYARALFRTLFPAGSVAAARARGLSGLRLARHFAPMAALPFVSILGAVVPALVAGSVVIEEAFSWPGLGRLLVHAVEGRDYPVVLALVLLSACAVLAGQLLVDLAYPALDPRLREQVAPDGSHGG
ncbi:MAG TPA: ABC transporter permease [Patescibacteria group bacterium]|nr:ABC transporter permease [Patescibacteria group bacterium]